MNVPALNLVDNEGTKYKVPLMDVIGVEAVETPAGPGIVFVVRSQPMRASVVEGLAQLLEQHKAVRAPDLSTLRPRTDVVGVEGAPSSLLLQLSQFAGESKGG